MEKRRASEKLMTLEEAAAGIPRELSKRLDKIHFDVTEPPDPPRVKCIQYKQMVDEMMVKAQKSGRDFQKDVFDLILIFLSQGNIIEKILNRWPESDRRRKKLITLADVYDLQSHCPYYESSPTLSRISAAYSHVTLVLADMMKSRPYGPQPIMWVADSELGAPVHDHFKMAYFPGLIDLNGCNNFKGQVGLLLHNVCHAKSIKYTSSEKTIADAFIISCRISAGVIEQGMAPIQAKKVFTKYIETLELDSKMLHKVWNQIIGDDWIPLANATFLTPFHEKVMKAQPLDQQKWRQLMDNS